MNKGHLSKAVRWAAAMAFGAILAPTLSRAEGKPPDPRALGMTEGILSYCAKVDPSAAAKYEEKVKLLVQGSSQETVAKVRASDEYKKARGSVDDFVSKVDEHNAKRVCSESVATTK